MSIENDRMAPGSDEAIERARWKETLEAMDSVAQGKVVPGEAVHAWLRSWGSADELPPPEMGR
jgi:predicted transcriptional regulator